LVQRCTQREVAAWTRLVGHYIGVVVAEAKHLLHERGSRSHVADEIVGRVWPALFKRQCLRCFDGQRSRQGPLPEDRARPVCPRLKPVGPEKLSTALCY
jgi:hypothetical protein